MTTALWESAGVREKIDGRTVRGRLIRDLKAELVEHLGGNPTPPQRLLVERVVQMKLRLGLLERKMVTMPSRWTSRDRRAYGSLCNAFRLSLLAIDRMKAPGRRKGPSIEDVVELHRRSA